jgi:hypothetical protein
MDSSFPSHPAPSKARDNVVARLYAAAGTGGNEGHSRVRFTPARLKVGALGFGQAF